MKTFYVKMIICLIVTVLILTVAVFWIMNSVGSKSMSFFEAMEEQWDIGSQKWTKCKILIPEERLNVFLAIRISHPFLAEYERKIILSDSSSNQVRIPIMSDTGGDTRLKVFWSYDNDRAYLRLVGIQGDWCVIDVLAKKLVSSSIVLTDDILLFNSDHEKRTKSYDDIDWQYIGMVKYDRPDYEKNLVFEENRAEIRLN